MFGVFVDGNTLHRFRELGVLSWVRVQGSPPYESDEEHYPEASRTGRELAQTRFVERIQNLDPTPTVDRDLLVVSREAQALSTALLTYLKLEISAGLLAPDEVNPTAVSACCASYGKTLAALFEEDRK